MWILPKQLISDFVPDTEGLSLDLNEQSQLCAQSLFVRSKPSQSQTWLQKWKRDSWTKHLYGRILKPSLGKAFEIAWTSSLEVIHASHSAQQESDQERMILDIYGPSSQAEFDFFVQESVSLRTSRDISLWGCPTSSKTWQEWVTERRLAYSQRLKSAHLINGSGSLSWPTISVNESKNSLGKSQCNRNSIPLGTMAMMHGHPVPASSSTHGSRLGLLSTPRTGATDSTRPNNKGGIPLGDQVQREDWPTVSSAGVTGGPTGLAGGSGNRAKMKRLMGGEMNSKLNPRWVEILMGLPVGWTMPSCREPITLCGEMIPQRSQEQWPTPSADGDSRPGSNADIEKWTKIRDEKKAQGINKQLFLTTKVMMEEEKNIRNYASPVTIERTNFDSLETELSQQQQSELFDC